MRLNTRIKELERKNRAKNPKLRIHQILYRLGVHNVHELIDEYRRKGGKLPVFALPQFGSGIHYPENSPDNPNRDTRLIERDI